MCVHDATGKEAKLIRGGLSAKGYVAPYLFASPPEGSRHTV